jgi:hypothetical protein
VEHTQRQESGSDRASTKVVHHQGPKTIRGGIAGESADKNVTSPPKSMRGGGGGGKHGAASGGSVSASAATTASSSSSVTASSEKDEDSSSFGKQASGFVSRLFHK